MVVPVQCCGDRIYSIDKQERYLKTYQWPLQQPQTRQTLNNQKKYLFKQHSLTAKSNLMVPSISYAQLKSFAHNSLSQVANKNTQQNTFKILRKKQIWHSVFINCGSFASESQQADDGKIQKSELFQLQQKKFERSLTTKLKDDSKGQNPQLEVQRVKTLLGGGRGSDINEDKSVNTQIGTLDGQDLEIQKPRLRLQVLAAVILPIFAYILKAVIWNDQKPKFEGKVHRTTKSKSVRSHNLGGEQLAGSQAQDVLYDNAITNKNNIYNNVKGGQENHNSKTNCQVHPNT